MQDMEWLYAQLSVSWCEMSDSLLLDSALHV